MLDVLHRLIDRYERRPSAEKNREKIRFETLASADDVAKLVEVLERLASSGAITLTYGKRGFRNTIDSVFLLDPMPVYRELGREPLAEIVAKAMALLKHEAEPWEREIVDHIEEMWSSKKKWYRFGPSDVAQLVDIQRVARAALSGNFEGVDYRTFSAKVTGDSKFLERNEASVVAYAVHHSRAVATTVRDIPNSNLANKIGLPIIMSGPVTVRGLPLGAELDYFGVPPHQLDQMELYQKIDYVLTIENMASFHRHALEINATRKGLVLFTGGQASSSFKRFYEGLVSSNAPSIPFYHWSDMDGGGMEITKILLSLNKSLRPHLMSVDLLERFGVAGTVSIASAEPFQGSWLGPIAEALVSMPDRVLEQERVDPQLPRL